MKKTVIETLLREYTNLHTCISFQIEVRAIFTKPDLEEGIAEGTFYINHPYTKIELAQVLDNYGFSTVIENVYQILSNNAEEIATKGSNWTLSKIVQINLYINRDAVV